LVIGEQAATYEAISASQQIFSALKCNARKGGGRRTLLHHPSMKWLYFIEPFNIEARVEF
jgi:hypothetical protein